jgi:hypothetical protein
MDEIDVLGNGSGNEGERGPEAEQSVDDALVAPRSDHRRRNLRCRRPVVDTTRRHQPWRPWLVGAVCWNKLDAMRSRMDVEPDHAAQCVNRPRDA